MKHTPGEWEDSRQCDAVVTKTKPEGFKYYGDAETEKACLAYYGGYVIAESVQERDRPLIKAAPDLLLACENLLREPTTTHRREARAAIAKAVRDE